MYSICTRYLKELIDDEKNENTQLDEFKNSAINEKILNQMKEDYRKMPSLKDEQ